MSDNITRDAATAMIDAVLAGLPKVDGDKDVEMTSPAAIPATRAGDADLEPGQIPPWEDKMDAESITQAAKPNPTPVGLPTRPVDVQSTLSRVGVAATAQQPAANSGRSMSTALSVSSTPRSNRVRLLPQSTPNRVASGVLSVTGSPSGRSVSGPIMGFPMGSLPFRPPAGAPRLGPSEQRNRLGHNTLPAVPDRHGGPVGGSAQSSQPSSTAAARGVPPTQLLSAECQRRGFNPEWQFLKTNVGRVVCHVKVGDTWVEGKTSHNNEQAAKASTSKEALKVVKQMPHRASGLHSFAANTNISAENRPLGDNRPVFRQETGFGRAILPPQPTIRTSSTVVKMEEDVVMRDIAAEQPVRPINTGTPETQSQAVNQALNRIRGRQMDTRRRRTQGHQRTGANARDGSGRTSTATEMAARSENISDDALLADYIRRSMGENFNPEASRAFLEGLALGSRLGTALDRVQRSRRESRSRSPTARRRDDRHRARSPRSPRTSRIRLSPTPQYHVPGRSSLDSYRPVGAPSGQRDGETERRRENPVSRSTHTAPTERRGANDEAWVHDLFFRHNRIKVEDED